LVLASRQHQSRKTRKDGNLRNSHPVWLMLNV